MQITFSMKNRNVLVVSGSLTQGSKLKEWSAIAHPFHVNVVATDESAIECCHLRQFDIVVVDGTDESIDGKKLSAVLPILQENVIVLQYEGEEADKLTETIQAIFTARKFKRILSMIIEPGEKKFEIPAICLN